MGSLSCSRVRAGVLKGGGAHSHRSACQRVQGLGQRVQGKLGRGEDGPRRVVLSHTGAINLAHQLLHLLQGTGEHEDVVACQQQGGDLGELADRRALGVRHDFAETVHGLVEVVHPFALAAVHLETQLLKVFFRSVWTVLTFPSAGQRSAGGFLALLEHLAGEEAGVDDEVRGRGATAGGACVGIHLSRSERS